jgi:hypothetical protein
MGKASEKNWPFPSVKHKLDPCQCLDLFFDLRVQVQERLCLPPQLREAESEYKAWERGSREKGGRERPPFPHFLNMTRH